MKLLDGTVRQSTVGCMLAGLHMGKINESQERFMAWFRLSLGAH